MMKVILTVGLITLMTVARGQDNKSYWVVETPAKGNSIVKIYSGNRLLRESAVARRIDINKKRERRILNRMLKQNDELLWSKR